MLTLERNEIVELALSALSLSNDGNDLEPRHLRLVEMCVNGNANERGQEILHNIVRELKAGTYNPWYFGIKGLVLKDNGYVLYNDKIVEHFSFLTGNYSDEARQELADHLLPTLGISQEPGLEW